MKNISTVISVVLLVLVGILFYLHFSGSPKKTDTVALATPKANPGDFKIAYFEMDSIENNYEYLKDIRNQLKTKEQALYSELSGMKKSYMQEVNKFNQEAPTMSQEKAGATQQELMQKQKSVQDREQAMGLEMQDATFKKMQEANKRIEEFLKTYNADKRFSYILAYQPGTFYYKDPSFNITDDVVKGLNELYKKKD